MSASSTCNEYAHEDDEKFEDEVDPRAVEDDGSSKDKDKRKIDEDADDVDEIFI